MSAGISGAATGGGEAPPSGGRLGLARRDWLRLVAIVAGVLMLAALPALVPGFYVTLATRMLILGLFATAFNIVFGFGGMHSLGHAAFFGLGGYAVGLGVTRWEWGFVTILVVAVALGAAVGLVYGVLTQRTNGIYLLLLTLALGQAVWGLAFQQVALTRGDNGIAGVERAVIPLVGAGALSWYHFVVVVALLGMGVLWWFTRSPVGRAIVGSRESRSRMAALGFRVGVYRNVAFVVSGAFTALAGVLYAWHHRFVSPEMLFWEMSALILVVAVIGGANTFLGPALGAAIIVGLEFWVSLYTARWMSVLGLVYIATILLLPQGILGLFDRRRGAGTDGDDDGNDSGPVPAVEATR